MPQYLTPGVYVEEILAGTRPIEGVGTNVAAFVGLADDSGRLRRASRPPSTTGRSTRTSSASEGPSSALTLAVHGFFLNGGQRCYVLNVGKGGSIGGTPVAARASRARAHRRDRDRRRARISRMPRPTTPC